MNDLIVVCGILHRRRREGRGTLLQSVDRVLGHGVLCLNALLNEHIAATGVGERVTLLEEDVVLHRVRLVDHTVVVLVGLHHHVHAIGGGKR